MAKSPRARSGEPPAAVTLASRDELIRVEAYLRYERNGRTPGRELDDWLEAEREVDRMMALLMPSAPVAEEARAAAPRRRRRAATAGDAERATRPPGSAPAAAG